MLLLQKGCAAIIPTPALNSCSHFIGSQPTVGQKWSSQQERLMAAGLQEAGEQARGAVTAFLTASKPASQSAPP